MFNIFPSFSSLLSANKTHPKFKTKLIKREAEPAWNMSFEYTDVSYTDLQNSSLQFSVYDKKVGLLGGTRLGLGQQKDLYHDLFGEEINIWT